jgi:hypothetical protein
MEQDEIRHKIRYELSEIAIDRVTAAMGYSLPKEVKEQIIKDSEAIAAEWELEQCPLNDIKEN